MTRPLDFLVPDPQGLTERIRTIPHVRHVSPRIHFSGLLSTGDTSVSFIGVGLDPAVEEQRQSIHIEAGRMLSGETYEVLLGKGLARSMKLKPGDSVVLVASTQQGGINAADAQVVGTFGTADKAFDDRAVRLPIRLAQTILRTEGVESLTVFLDGTEHTDETKRVLGASLPEAKDLDIKAWHELEEADQIAKLAAVYQGIFGVVRLIIFLVVTLGIMNTLNMAVYERIGEIGTLRAVGLQRGQVAGLFLAEGALLGILGGVIGCVLGAILAAIISKIGIPMPTPPNTTIQWIARIAVSWSVLWPAGLLAFATAAVSSVLPARKAAGLEIAESLRHNI
jgi:putative ABC transport system permease protein